jgi:hypothetical protein
MKRSRLNPYSKSQIPKLKRKLDILFSFLIRERDKNDPCITCPKTKATFHAGHFRPRGFMATRWNPFNVNKQCNYCNVFKDGAAYEYGIALDKKYVLGTAAELYRVSQQIKQWDARELTALIAAAKLGYSYYVDLYQKIGPQ